MASHKRRLSHGDDGEGDADHEAKRFKSSECSAPAPDVGVPFRSPHFIPLTFASGKRVLLDIKRPKRYRTACQQPRDHNTSTIIVARVEEWLAHIAARCAASAGAR